MRSAVIGTLCTQNFARSAEQLARDGAAGFDRYVQDLKAKDPTQVSDSVREGSFDEVVELTWDDALDLVNPMQHIPIVNNIYRAVTGDTIKPSIQVVGDMAYGLLSGNILLSGLSAVTSAAIEQQTGVPPAIQLAQAVFGTPNQATSVASAATATEPTALPSTLVADLSEAAPSPAITKAGLSIHDAIQNHKQPFGGVMDSYALTGERTVIPEKTVIAAAPHKKEAQPFVAQKLTRITPKAKDEAVQLAQSAMPHLGVSALGIPGMSGSNGTTKTLGGMLGSLSSSSSASSKLASKDERLSSNLVHNMMMMGLDKYQTAQGLAPSELKITSQPPTL